MTHDVDVIIVSHNTRADLIACLASLFNASPRALHSVVVVDNASTDGSAPAVSAAWPDVRVVSLDRNRGFAAANNIALRDCTAEFALLLNSDTIVRSGAVDTLVERAVATGSVAAGPRLVDAAGRPEVSFGRMLSPWSELVQLMRVRLAAHDSAAARRYIARLLAQERGVDWVTGACLLVRRQAALDAGLLDERYFMYEEDVDFCAALRARGGRILFTPRAEIVHARGRSVAKAGADRRATYDRSHLAFYQKHLPAWAPLLRWWQRLGRSR